ncbi:MAG TPA: PadR family transcriptional regulator [Candidatus Dormibacteraeota bacterium]|nr:PadR family transcriptional regulator [Candidatus Dormibacteraeota bacterium]
MFDNETRRAFARHRHGDLRGEMGRQLREELRRNLRHGGGRPQFSFREAFGHAGPGGPIRRGEIRPLILAALLKKPMHGYEVIQELEAQSGGRWRPSAGSVYPTLQQLADEGLVTSEEVDGRRTYTLTEDGRKAAAETGTRSPWADDKATDHDRQPDIRQLAMQLAAAVIQVNRMGSPRARREATRILTDARKQMYRLLSEDEDASTGEADEGATSAPSEADPA